MSYTLEEDAARHQILLRAFLFGPQGSGKSKAALELASRLAARLDVPVTLINTELGRGRLYADRYKFGLIDMAEQGGDFSPESWEAAINVAEQRRPGGVIVLDSVSHEWMGRNGILQQADRFGDWKTVRPKHNAWVDRLLGVNGHLIVTCRAKMKYEVTEEEVPGRTKPRQVVSMLGVGPIQSDDLLYEFNLIGRIDRASHDIDWSGHVDPLVDTVTNLGDDEQADRAVEQLVGWLDRGNPLPPAPEAATDEAIAELVAILTAKEKPDGSRLISDELIEETFAKARRANRGVLTAEYVAEQTEKQRPRPKDTTEPAA